MNIDFVTLGWMRSVINLIVMLPVAFGGLGASVGISTASNIIDNEVWATVSASRLTALTGDIEIGARGSSELDALGVATSLAVIKATRDAEDALSWITPSCFSGIPIAPLSHSTIRCSSSAAEGDVSQIIHWAPIAEVINSASIDSTELFAGK